MRALFAVNNAVPVSIALVVMLCASGCFRYQTQVPGVVDMRTDASDAPSARPAPPDDEEIAREPGPGLLLGKGVSTEGDRVVIEERHVFLRGLVPVWNTSAKEELAAGLALSGALRDLELGEEYGVLDIGITLLASFLPLAGWLVPSTYTFRASGDAIALDQASSGRRKAVPLPLPLDDLPPPPPLEDLEIDSAPPAGVPEAP